MYNVQWCMFCFTVCVKGQQQQQSGEAREISALVMKGLSARERNRAKRKAKQMARRNSRDKDTPEKV